MGEGRNAIPAVEKQPEEDRLGEKREAFERERHADDGARVTHEPGPEQAELEGERGTTVYEVEVVTADNKVFDIKVDAADGKVLSSKQDQADRGEKDDDKD